MLGICIKGKKILLSFINQTHISLAYCFSTWNVENVLVYLVCSFFPLHLYLFAKKIADLQAHAARRCELADQLFFGCDACNGEESGETIPPPNEVRWGRDSMAALFWGRGLKSLGTHGLMHVKPGVLEITEFEIHWCNVYHGFPNISALNPKIMLPLSRDPT